MTYRQDTDRLLGLQHSEIDDIGLHWKRANRIFNLPALRLDDISMRECFERGDRVENTSDNIGGILWRIFTDVFVEALKIGCSLGRENDVK